MKSNHGILWGLAFMLLFAFAMPAYGADEVSKITAEELNGILYDPSLVILDVRTERDWTRSKTRVIGAVRADPRNVSNWAEGYAKTQKIVLYCA